MSAEKKLDDYKQTVNNLLSKIIALEERLKVCNKNLYGDRSKRVSIKRSGSPKMTIYMIRMILTEPHDPSNHHCLSIVRIICGKRTWK